MTNIRDIAKMAGVSVTTVSRVLNHHPYVSEAKRAAVLEAIKKSHYHRNINAVHLSKGKTNLIGVAVPFLNHPYFGQLMEGIADEAITQNHQLVLFQTNYEPQRELEALKMLKYKQIDALIICSRAGSWEWIEEYQQYGTIVLCEDARKKPISCTFIHHYQCFQAALDFLHQKGHRKIGISIGRTSGTNSHQRLRAYRDFLKNINEPYKKDYVFDHCLVLEDGVDIIERISKMSEPPSALVITSDEVAAGALLQCQQKGISVPEQLAIIGFNNQPISYLMNMTTIDIPLSEMGRSLFRQACDGTRISQKEMSYTLVERSTV